MYNKPYIKIKQNILNFCITDCGIASGQDLFRGIFISYSRLETVILKPLVSMIRGRSLKHCIGYYCVFSTYRAYLMIYALQW